MMSDAQQYAVWPYPRSRSRLTSRLKLEIRPFSSYFFRHLQWELAT